MAHPLRRPAVFVAFGVTVVWSPQGYAAQSGLPLDFVHGIQLLYELQTLQVPIVNYTQLPMPKGFEGTATSTLFWTQFWTISRVFVQPITAHPHTPHVTYSTSRERSSVMPKCFGYGELVLGWEMYIPLTSSSPLRTHAYGGA